MLIPSALYLGCLNPQTNLQKAAKILRHFKNPSIGRTTNDYDAFRDFRKLKKSLYFFHIY